MTPPQTNRAGDVLGLSPSRKMTATEGHVPVAENSNAIALGLLGDEWNLTIVQLAIMSGVSRHKEFRDSLGIANSVLTIGPRLLPARYGHAGLGRQVAPRARGTGHDAHPHRLRREFRPVLHCPVCGLELHGSQIQVFGVPPKTGSNLQPIRGHQQDR
jgi:hypothetical protein